MRLRRAAPAKGCGRRMLNRPRPEERAWGAGSATRARRARVSKDGAASCFKTHRSAAETANAPVPGIALRCSSARGRSRWRAGLLLIHCCLQWPRAGLHPCRREPRICALRRKGEGRSGGAAVAELPRLRQRRGLPRGRRAVGEFRHHLRREQPHGFLRFARVDGAEIDLQRGMLEFADGCDHAADDRRDLRGRADPGAARFRSGRRA